MQITPLILQNTPPTPISPERSYLPPHWEGMCYGACPVQAVFTVRLGHASFVEWSRHMSVMPLLNPSRMWTGSFLRWAVLPGF